MMKIASFVAALSLLCSSTMAQDVTTTNEVVDLPPAIAPLAKDERAPFEGVLYSPEAVARTIADVKELPQKIDLEVKHAVENIEAKCEAEKKNMAAASKADTSVLSANLSAAKKERDLVLKEVKRLERKGKLQKLWIVVSGVAGLVVAGVVVGAGVGLTK